MGSKNNGVTVSQSIHVPNSVTYTFTEAYAETSAGLSVMKSLMCENMPYNMDESSRNHPYHNQFAKVAQLRYNETQCDSSVCFEHAGI